MNKMPVEFHKTYTKLFLLVPLSKQATNRRFHDEQGPHHVTHVLVAFQSRYFSTETYSNKFSNRYYGVQSTF